MLVVISPAKRLDWRPASHGSGRPRFLDDAARLAAMARRLSRDELAQRMRLSPALAVRAQGWLRDWRCDPAREATRAAALGFAGDTYTGLHYPSFEPDMRDHAARHLRILSGLYGLLAPEDAILPHRLEMGMVLPDRRVGRLREWWFSRIGAALAGDAAASGADFVVNLASVAYFAAVDQQALGRPVVTPRFEEARAGLAPRVEALHAKRARGAMARFIIENRLTDPGDLRHFDALGYRFEPGAGGVLAPLFRREWPE